MKKYFLTPLILLTIWSAQLPATIIETQQIEQILPYVESDTLVLFNIAEVLTDSTISLGSSPWRKYVKKIAPTQHDALTFQAAKSVPHKAVEDLTPQFIKSLQAQEIPVAALTSRGRTEWYSTKIAGVDELTETMLEKMDIDFTKSSLPFVFIQMEDSKYSAHFHKGIFYANHMEKGQFLTELLQDTGYHPTKVILVDDKRDSLEEVEKAIEELQIPFIGFWYTRTKEDHKDFSAMIANIQLERLLFKNQILSDAEAQKLLDEEYSGIDPDDFLRQILSKIQMIPLR